jgi:hypothetical protein
MTDTGMMVLCASQDEISITFDADGSAVITQTGLGDEDQSIFISPENIDGFIDKLTDALGIPSSKTMLGQWQSNESNKVESNKSNKSNDVPRRAREPSFDKKTYQRDLMKKRRAAEKASANAVTTTAPQLPELELNGGGNTALTH